MSLENPTSILVDNNGIPVGTPTNVLYVSGSITGSTTVSGAVSVIGTTQVTGSIFVDNFPAVQSVTGSVALTTPVTIANFPAVQTVTGSLTATQVKSAAASTFAISASAGPTAILASNSARLGAIFVNDSPSIAFLRFGDGATNNNWTYRMFPGTTIELNEPVFDGNISAAWNVVTGSMRVTELT